MAGFITLDGKKYLNALDFTPRCEKSQSVQMSLSGKTLVQTFAVIDKTWDVTILVDLYRQNPEYGCRADLLAAWSKEYVPFSDPFGAQHDVFIANGLEEQLKYAIVDETAKFEVKLGLRLRQG